MSGERDESNTWRQPQHSAYRMQVELLRWQLRNKEDQTHLVDWLIAHEPLVDMPWRNLAGRFEGVNPHRSYRDVRMDLFPEETLLLGLIHSYRQRQKTVRILGLGEGFSESFLAVSTHLHEEIRSGEVQLIVTQHDEQWTLPNMVAEMYRRYEIAPQVEQLLKDYWPPNHRSPLIDTLLQHHKYRRSRESLEWTERNVGRITWLTGVDSQRLLNDLTVRLGEGIRVHLAHERYGGIYHAANKTSALYELLRCMEPGALLMTFTDLFGRNSFSPRELEYLGGRYLPVTVEQPDAAVDSYSLYEIQ